MGLPARLNRGAHLYPSGLGRLIPRARHRITLSTPTNKWIQLNMEDDDFEEWKLCWQVNYVFNIKRPRSLGSPVLCIGCGERAMPWSSTHRSEFVATAIRCPVGHLDWVKSSDVDICAKCNQDFALRVSRRQQVCSTEGCRRFLVVDEQVIKNRLGHNSHLAR